ncbi:BofC C-terminal domain-containing protein [Camelliibacillus cellulosilyticus]
MWVSKRFLIFTLTAVMVITGLILPRQTHALSCANQLNPVKEKSVSEEMGANAPVMITVHFKETYIDGVSIEREDREHYLSFDTLITEHPGWRVVDCSKGNITFSKTVDDLSPVSKAAGIFGLKDNHILTLYFGEPSNDKIIRTFFQIDVGAMESNAVLKLKHGIRITNKKDYQTILHSMSKYAIHTVSTLK